MGKEKGREILYAGSVDALLLTGAANMRYVAGFTGEGYVYLSKNSAVVVTDSRYTIAARAECEDFVVEEWNGKPYYEILKEYNGKGAYMKKLVESPISWSSFTPIRFPGAPMMERFPPRAVANTSGIRRRLLE